MRIGVGLSIPELATRGGKFSPLSLFSGGAKGAWYDPSDYSTLFQDSAGTTPVTAVEQPVGLMLDKSQGLVIGSEQIVNGSFATDSDWTKISGATISGGVANLFNAAANPAITQTRNFTLGRTYLVSLTWTGTISVGMGNYGSGDIRFLNNSTAGSWTGYVTLSAGTGATFWVQAPINVSSTVDNISVKELAGNHASQSTAASRPVLRARYNLLTYSEQFDNAIWTKAQTTVTANATTAPDGTTTADKLLETAVTNVHGVYATFTYVSGATYTASVYAKAAERSWIYLGADTSAAESVFFDLSTGSVGNQGTGYVGSIQSVGDGWYRCTVVITQATALPPNYFVVGVATANNTASYAGNATSGVFIWGADLRTGSSAGTYQRIAAATDYATAGFLPYLDLITDDSLATGSIDFSATDKMSVCAGVTKNSDSATAVIAELGPSASATDGTWGLLGPGSAATATYAQYLRGTVAANIFGTPSNYAAPITNVLTGVMDIGAATAALQSILRVNATPISSSGGKTTAGNFANYPLYIGRRNNASLPFNGRIYQLIVCGKTLTAAELVSTEAFVAAKTGVTL